MSKFNVILLRFSKGMLAGIATSLSLVSIQQPAVWSDFKTVLNVVGIAVVYGALTGLILAIQKAASWVE